MSREAMQMALDVLDRVDHDDDLIRDLEAAQAALRAALAQGEAGEWVMVPRVPTTKAMLDAGAMEIAMNAQRLQTAEQAAAKVYRAMIAAAPPPPAALAQGETQPVGTLNVSRFRGFLENHDFDYTASLPDGTYLLYAAPPPPAATAQTQSKAVPKFDHSIGDGRYTVVRGSFWWHVRIGDSTANIGKFHTERAAQDMALKLLTAFRDGAFVQHEALTAALEARNG